AKVLAQATALLEVPESEGEDEDFERAELVSSAADVYEQLGRVCVQARHWDRAIIAYRKAQEKDPDRKRRLAYNLADVYLAQHDFSRALACLDLYLQTQPQGIEAYERKIQVLKQLRRGEEIVAALERHVAIDRNNTSLKQLLGRELGRAGQ